MIVKIYLHADAHTHNMHRHPHVQKEMLTFLVKFIINFYPNI